MRILYLPNEYSQQRQREKPAHIYPVLLAMEAEWYRRRGHEVTWEASWKRPIIGTDSFDKIISEPEGLPFLSLPHPDRVFTKAKEYNSGNYKYFPGTHMQVANHCWWGKCTFCVENGRPYEVRPVEDCIQEIEEIKSQGYREVFDDSGSFPTGNWLNNFCNRLYNLGGIRFGCNMRVVDIDYNELANSGFRMVLFGIESANQETLDKINKGVKVEDIIPTIKKASESGLEPHIAVMFGYPWESDEDAERTLKLVHYLLCRGFAKTAQASFFNQPPWKSNESHRKFVRGIYGVWKDPYFIFNQLKDIRDVDDIKYLWRKIKTGIGGQYGKM